MNAEIIHIEPTHVTEINNASELARRCWESNDIRFDFSRVDQVPSEFVRIL